MVKVKDIKSGGVSNNPTPVKKPKTSKLSKEQTLEEIYHQEIKPPKIITKSEINLKVLILLVIISLLGGFVAGLVQDNLYDSYYRGTALDVDKDKGDEDQILDLNFLLKEEDDAYGKVLTEIRSQLVGFYKSKKAGGILDSIYLEKDFLGSGIVVTSDGWLLTHQSVITDEDYVIVTNNKETFVPTKEVIDEFSGTVLIKIAKEGLAPARFAEVNNLSATNVLLSTRYSIQNHGSDIIKTSLQKFSYHDQSKGEDFLLSTEAIDHYLKVANQFEDVYNGAALINDKNEVVGVLFNSGRDLIDLAIPAYYLKSATNNFLVNSQEIIRSDLGVYYIDLSESIGLSTEVTEGRINGAVLLGNAAKNILAVETESVAAEAGLKAGDIVIKVNGEDIDEKNSLTKLIQDYTPGQEVSLMIVRAGEEMEIKVVLGEM